MILVSNLSHKILVKFFSGFVTAYADAGFRSNQFTAEHI